jgi:hypothetical protein
MTDGSKILQTFEFDGDILAKDQQNKACCLVCIGCTYFVVGGIFALPLLIFASKK